MLSLHARPRRAPRILAAAAVAFAAVLSAASPVHAAPTAPVIEVLTASPQAGQAVEVRLTASDAESDIVAFHYGINVEGRQHTVESTGETVISFTVEAGPTSLYVWAENADGEYSARATTQIYATRFIAPIPKAAWRLDGNGIDDANGAGALDVPVDAAWEATAAPAPFGRALAFDGGCASSANGSAVRTDASFWISAWVRLDSKAADQVIVSKTGQHRTGFALGYDAETDRFTVTLADRDVASGHREHRLDSATAPEAGVWTQVSATVDRGSARVRIYLGGVLDAESTYAFGSGAFTGAFHLGCDAGTGADPLTGALTHVGVWQGLPNQAYLDAAYRGEFVPGTAAEWRLRGDGSDASVQEHALELPSTVAWEADQYGRAASAAAFDGDSCALSTDHVLSSQGDLTAEAWVRLDDTGRDQTVLAQNAGRRNAFSLGYDADSGMWELALPSDNGRRPHWVVVSATTAASAGEWTHLAATVSTDRTGAGKLALYVNGVLEASTELTFTPLAGKDLVAVGCSANTWGQTSGHFDGALSGVRLWRGALGADQVTVAYSGNPAAVVRAGWEFSFGDIDNWADVELQIVGDEGADWIWEDVFEGTLWTALRLDGTGNGYGTTEGPVLTTDESFSVITAINLAGKTTDQTFVAQAGPDGAGFVLGYDAALDRIHFTMPSADGTAAQVVTPSAPATGQWIYIAAVYDLKAGTMRLYVDGTAVATADGPSSPWNAEGPVTLGITANAEGAQPNPLNGGISNTFLFESVASERTIKVMAGIF
jgi:hypothetical protein